MQDPTVLLYRVAWDWDMDRDLRPLYQVSKQHKSNLSRNYLAFSEHPVFVEHMHASITRNNSFIDAGIRL